eukprot:CAMPEP_0194282398 /NCGR_PEP_ID=MMETSP0169-20130528/22997_1 /TAXON_ID=218684 /ORGANISM="Corethron pennatum, Strain L29A3" /LENGTH=447 /DNA_ID=CAMNT_0039027695 /DNA_START=90 /DNA_END=1433 /DNA_ORIENTATION=-
MSKVKKSPRDPNAPKRNMSAYLFYQNAMRDQFKAQNPGMTFGQLAKYTSAMYAEMQPEEKQAWNARAHADKARYLHELAAYVPAPGFDAKGDPLLPSPITVINKGKRIKQGRDANAPKRNIPAYLLYQNAMRESFKAQNPGLTFGELAQYTSAMYKTLTPEEKGVWQHKALADKTRYGAEMVNYVPSPGYDAKGNMLESAMTEKKRRKKSPKDPLAPKRSRGSYVFFTYDARPEIKRENPTIKFTDMGHVMGHHWRALTPEQKSKYEDLANQDRVRFATEMEKYNMHRAMDSAVAVKDNAHLVYQQQMEQQQQLYKEYQQEKEQKDQQQQHQQQLQLQQEQQEQQQLQLQQEQRYQLQQEQHQQQLQQEQQHQPQQEQHHHLQQKHQQQLQQQQQQQAYQQEEYTAALSEHEFLEYQQKEHQQTLDQMYVPQIPGTSDGVGVYYSNT